MLGSVLPDTKRDHGDQPTILVVDDQRSIRTLIHTVLSAAGYAILEASSGESAVALAEDPTTPIDLVLIDVMLPVLNGIEAVERMETFRPGLKVLFMSGHTREAIALQGIFTRDVEFLHKPFTLDDLRRRVRATLMANPPSHPAEPA